MVFPAVMYGCESWTIKKAERWRIDAFELWYWRRLLTSRRSNESILKEISPEYSLEGLMLKLKLQYFGHLMQRTDTSEKTLMLGKIEGRKRMGWQKMRCLDGITDLMDMNLSKFQKLMMDREGWHTAFEGVTKSWTWLSNWSDWMTEDSIASHFFNHNWLIFFTIVKSWNFCVLEAAGNQHLKTADICILTYEETKPKMFSQLVIGNISQRSQDSISIVSWIFHA